MYNKDTKELIGILNKIEKKKEFRNFINGNLNNINEISIGEFFCNICNEYSISKGELIRRADIDRTYGYQILDGRKNPGRDKIIRLCLALNLDLTKTNRALSIGKVSQLYSKRLRDSVIIFSINKKYSIMETNELLNEYDEELI